MAYQQSSGGSRNDRFTELTQQAKLIEQKKREIEQKLQQKSIQKEASDINNTVKIEKTQNINNKIGLGLKKSQSKFKIQTSSIKIENVKKEPSPTSVLPFKNDGSFLEQFKKMQAATTPTPGSSNSTNSIDPSNKPGVIMKLQAPSQKPPLSLNENVKALLTAEDEPAKIYNKFNESVSPPEDQAVRWAVEKVAISVAINGATAEEAARRENPENPSYWFLNDIDGDTYKYFQERVSNLKEAKRRAQDDGILTSMLTTDQSNESNPSTSSDTPQPKRKRKSRWGPQESPGSEPTVNALPPFVEKDPPLVTYALQVFGSTDLSFEQWKQLDDQRKMKILFQMMQAKQRLAEANARAGKVKYEYDSDEEVDGGTWEHKKRMEEMEKTQRWAEELTEKAKGKHHIGDFLPPEELEKFLEKWEALKEGRSADLSDYKEFKIQSDNVGYQMLQKLGWAEGQGLGSNGAGITAPINKGAVPVENAGLGQNRPDDVSTGDDEYEAYRKRMMLAYRFRPNPLNNPRRAYY